MDKIIVMGYGGHGKSVVDSIISSGMYEIVGYTDVEDRHAESIAYLGTDENLMTLFQNGVENIAFGIGYMGKSKVRDKLYENVKKIGFHLPPIIDPTAAIAADAVIQEGCFIGKRAVVNAGALISRMCIINTGAIVEHENNIDEYTHVAVGAVLCGNVTVGKHCLVGANSTVIQGTRIGDDVIVGAGSVVLNDIADSQIVAGVPARIIKRENAL